MRKNIERMLRIIDEAFATRNDPDQLQVTPAQQQKLLKIHPATLSELSDENGPLVWVLLIPRKKAIMDGFLKGQLAEKEILDRTKPGESYDCIYLCSATTLPEQRGKGKTKKLCLEAIAKISEDHPIKHLFVWPFSDEGERLADSLTAATGLQLHKKVTLAGEK